MLLNGFGKAVHMLVIKGIVVNISFICENELRTETLLSCAPHTLVFGHTLL